MKMYNKAFAADRKKPRPLKSNVSENNLSIEVLKERMSEALKKHGFFSLNELITTDLISAKEFYGELLGWTFTETKTIYGNPYLVIHKEGTIVGGMMLKEGNVSDDVALCWDPYITVEDVDASAKRVEKLGGEVVLPPTDIPKFGRFCVIKDPQGVSLNLITYKDNI